MPYSTKAMTATFNARLFARGCNVPSSTSCSCEIQGGTLGLAHLSRNPEAAEGLGGMIAVAPVVYAKYLLSPTLVAFSYQANVRGGLAIHIFPCLCALCCRCVPGSSHARVLACVHCAVHAIQCSEVLAGPCCFPPSMKMTRFQDPVLLHIH